MSLLRDDIGRKARRLFWEMCASREPVHYAVEVVVDRNGEQRHYLQKEDEDDVARWADNMLAEWDKRWIESTKQGEWLYEVGPDDEVGESINELDTKESS